MALDISRQTARRFVLSRQTARRFVLGRQGLWPGRRWSGLEGTAAALRQGQCVQIDPISAVARNHDITLWSRVEGYRPEMLDTLLHTHRLFFDYGDILMIYPAEELPYWRAVMRWQRDRMADAMVRHSSAIDHVREQVQERGPLASRDFLDREKIRGGFSTVKDSAMALYLLWLAGELTTHSRRGSDRVYDLSERLRGDGASVGEVTDEEALRFFTRKALLDAGLVTPQEWARRLRSYVSQAVPLSLATAIKREIADGFAIKVTTEENGPSRFSPAAETGLLAMLDAGETPAEWRRLGSDEVREATIVAPLDNVIWDRQRALALFDFDYVWEVYKPAHLRRWGYYTLPLLWGDRFTARVALRLNRKTRTMVVEGFWQEISAGPDDAQIEAVRRGLGRFAAFAGADTVAAHTAGDSIPNVEALGLPMALDRL